jgi:uncharacterized protein YukE
MSQKLNETKVQALSTTELLSRLNRYDATVLFYETVRNTLRQKIETAPESEFDNLVKRWQRLSRRYNRALVQATAAMHQASQSAMDALIDSMGGIEELGMEAYFPVPGTQTYREEEDQRRRYH